MVLSSSYTILVTASLFPTRQLTMLKNLTSHPWGGGGLLHLPCFDNKEQIMILFESSELMLQFPRCVCCGSSRVEGRGMAGARARQPDGDELKAEVVWGRRWGETEAVSLPCFRKDSSG